MSFIITVYTNEGIIMASDSRTTYTTTKTLSDGTVEKNVGVQLTDTTYKTFKCNSRIGLSTCGTASINDMPIAGFIEEFIAEKVTDNSSVEEEMCIRDSLNNVACYYQVLIQKIQGKNKFVKNTYSVKKKSFKIAIS